MTVGVSREEEPVDWTAEDYENFCRIMTGKRLGPDAVRIARREELEFIDKIAVLKEAHRSASGLTSAKGDGDRIEIRSRLTATELNVHHVKIGILRVDVFSATPPFVAVRLLMSSMTTEPNDKGQVGVDCCSQTCVEHETRWQISQRSSRTH